MGTFRINRATMGKALPYVFVGNLLPIAVAIATDFGSHRTVFFIGAAGAALAPLGVLLFSRRRHPALFYLAAFGGLPSLMLLQAYTGGAASGYAVLTMMAMVWFGLQATDRELVFGFGLLAACSYLPMLIVGPPAYPVSWGHATLLLLVGVAVAGSLRTMTREMERLTTRLREEAVVDDLTGLLNRRGWRQEAGKELARASREEAPLALVAIDLDDLKEINDSMGHDEGDRVLRETAERMRTALRPEDTLARLGGDEFVALVPGVTLDDALGVVERLRETTPDRASFSAGLAARNRGEGLDDLVRRADFALYSAKNGGRDKLSVAPVQLVPNTAPVEADRL